MTTVLSAMDQYHQLNVPVPPVLMFFEAKAAAAANNPLRAFESLEEFLKNASRDSPQYKEAVALYAPYQDGAQAAQRQIDERKRLADEEKHAEEHAQEQALRDAALQKLPAVLSEIHGNMRGIPAGKFRMGDISGNGIGNEKPVHTVNITAFRMSAYECTFDQYDTFAAATGRALPSDNGWGRGNRPVINVGWDDVEAFVAWLNQQISGKYRLPTEAEWEYAARAGSSTDYPWGNYDANKANGSGQNNSTALVGSFPANALGLYDMIGNVREWTQDCYHDSYNGAPIDGSPWTTGEWCSRRMFRGGSWGDIPTYLRVSARDWFVTSIRLNDLGFRLAQDL